MNNFNSNIKFGQIISITVGVENEDKTFEGLYIATRDCNLSEEAVLFSGSAVAHEFVKAMVEEGFLTKLPVIDVAIPKNLHETTLDECWYQGQHLTDKGYEVPAFRIVRVSKWNPGSHTRVILFRIEINVSGHWHEQGHAEGVFDAYKLKDAFIGLFRENEGYLEHLRNFYKDKDLPI
jgi:hypothetical protein